jgi:hypothetical protein
MHAAAGEQPDFDLVAASLRADAGDVEAFMPALASKLSGALPGRVEIRRRGRGLFRREQVIEGVAVSLGDNRYELAAGPGGSLQPRRSKVVRGIALSSDELGLDDWIDQLAHELAAAAAASEQDRAALAKLLGTA